MIFLFEQFAYSIDFLEKVLPQKEKGSNWNLPKGFVQKESNGLRKLDGVGYLYNANSKYAEEEKNISHKIVFVLPKVFLEEHKEDGNEIIRAFGRVIPPGKNFEFDDSTKEIPKEFLSNLSLWVCSSIGKYRLSNPADNSVDVPEAPDVRHFDSDELTPTLIDVKNAMKQFYAENRDLFVFIAKNKHCGNNHIDWRRTVARTQPFIQNGVPIYMDLENKKKVFDLDDRLLVLYFSAMNYIEETFPGFKMPHSEFYTPMRVNEFRRLLGHRGLMELRRVKHKYFADKFLRLYNIMKAFFEWGGNFSANGFQSEYLLTSKYNNVFEAMIDKLVGDGGKSIDSLKHNDDGKIIDHLYKEPSIIFASGDAEKIWHIGDSKYYKDPDDIKGESIAKQFTYAKNVIQDFFSPRYVNKETKNDKDNAKLHSKDIHSGVRYRDPLTEGYSVTPNFFIRGFLPKFDTNVNDDSQYKDAYFRPTPQEKGAKKGKDDERELFYLPEHEKVSEDNEESNINVYLWEKRNRHFKNRLFDRDTLLLQVYNVNFLYVLKAYTSKRSSLREDFKRDAREKFRRNFLDLLDKKYVFYAVWPKDALAKDGEGSAEESFVNAHFRVLAGKIFKPKDVKCLIMALEKESASDSECEKMWNDIEKDCSMVSRVSPREIWDDDYEKYAEQYQLSRFDSQKGNFLVKHDFFRANQSCPLSEYAKSMTGVWYNKENIDLDKIREYLEA